MTDHYGGIAYCFLCIVYSYFHVCFICSLTIILCVLKTIQPTPLVVEPGRYSQKNSSGASACERAAAEHVLGEAGVAVPLDWTAPDDRGWGPRGIGMAPPDKAPRGHRKASLTKGIGALRRFMAEQDKGKVESQLMRLKELFDEFDKVHDDYHKALAEEQDIFDSEEYFSQAEQTYIAAVSEGHEWLARKLGKPVDTGASGGTGDKMMDMLYMPQVTIDVFTGDPLRYHEFMAVFDESVGNKPVDGQHKLTRLLQFTSGDAKNAIRRCALVGGSKGYQQARDILRARFGNKFFISQSIVDNLKCGKPVSTAAEIQQLANDLSMAAETLKELDMSSEIENQRSIMDIVQRCAPHIRNKWIKKALDDKDDKDEYPKFQDFVKFMERVAKQSLDPVYGTQNVKSHKSGGKVSSCHSVNNGAQVSPESGTNGNSSQKVSCKLCNQYHRLFQCESFKAMSPKARRDFVHRNKLCYLCFFPHLVRNCKKQYVCTVPGCGERHSKFIHVDDRRTNVSQNGNSNADFGQNTQTVNNGDNGHSNSCRSNVYLPIVPVKVNDDPNTYYALLDTGSTNSFVTETLATRLNLRTNAANYNISTISSQSHIDKVVSLHLKPLDGDDPVVVNSMLVIPDIPAKRPRMNIDVSRYPHLSGLPLDHGTMSTQVDILIGMDNSHLLVPYEVRCNPKGKNEPFASRTYLGWALSGPVPGSSTQVVSHFVHTELEQQFENLWRIESDDVDRCGFSLDDRKVLEMWDRETVFIDGHYSVPIPWKQERPCLPDNMRVALHRLHGLRRRLEKNELMSRYDEGVRKFLDRGYAEKVPDNELHANDGTVWYLPHHPVVSEAKGGKLRIVMDCSAKLGDVSLNNQCLRGPDFVNKLIHVILRFRQYRYAIMGDIESMYMQVKIPIRDRNALRFIWYDSSGRFVHYRMTSHVFGGVWSGSSSTYALRRTCQDNDVSDLVSDVITRSFYVDDLLRSSASLSEAREVIVDTRRVLNMGGFNLTKFVVNDSALLADIAVPDRSEQVVEITSEVVSKALGTCWDVTADSFYYVNRPLVDVVSNVTQRSILKQVSSMYDPLGLITPIVLKGRMIFQAVVRLKLQWDEPVPGPLADKWLSWLASLSDLSSLRFSRCLVPECYVDGVAELIHFSDASQAGYGACSYLRIVTHSGSIHVALIMSKGRLAPLKTVTIPRLELCAAVLAVRLDVLLRRELDIQIVRSSFFTDSAIARAYIQNESKRFKVFVANRVSEIRQHSHSDQWHHIDGKQNPADILSRGCDVEKMPSNWFHGPKFLSQFRCDWPADTTPPELNDDCETLPSHDTHFHVCTTDTPVHPVDKLTQHYRSFYRMKKAISWLLRFKAYLRHKVRPRGPITVSELNAAERLVLMHVQSREYPDELAALRACKPVARSSPVLKLDPMIHDGFLVVGGRLRHSRLMFQTRHPIILPANHLVSKMIVHDTHGETHFGVEWTLSKVRFKYWIVNARNMIKAVKRACVVCRKLYASPMHQKMSDLPPERCEPFKPPFTDTGFDVFGPFYVKHGRSEAKRYGIVFTCFTTRAIHIEKLNSLETDAFINALIRFVSRRGCPKTVRCDNATNFVGGNNELSKSLRQLDRNKIVQTARRFNTEWIFNTPLASHHGGVWERLIRTIRKVLTAILHKNARLTDDSLHTFFCEVENVVNGRPLTKCSSDVNDETPLTPNHLLILGGNMSLPIGVFHDSDKYRKQWRHVQSMVNAFWRRWVAEYLPQLQSRQKWQRIRPNVCVGDLVLIVDENSPRGYWPLGLVIELIKGRDDLVRSVKMRARNKVVVRPITKVVLLEGNFDAE